MARAEAWEMHPFPCGPWCEVTGPTVHLSHVVHVTGFCAVAPRPDCTVKCVKEHFEWQTHSSSPVGGMQVTCELEIVPF